MTHRPEVHGHAGPQVPALTAGHAQATAILSAVAFAMGPHR